MSVNNLITVNNLWIDFCLYDKLAVTCEPPRRREQDRRPQGPARLRVADGTAFALDVSMVLLMSTQCTGKNLPLAPFSQMDDGKIDFLILENKSRLETLKLFNAVKAQGRHVFAKSGVHYLRVKESLTIEADAPEAINIDGENVGSTPFSMKCLPGAIPILLPAAAGAAGGGDRV